MEKLNNSPNEPSPKLEKKRKIIEEEINYNKDNKIILKSEKAQLIFQTRTHLKYIDKSSQFLLSDFYGNGFMDLFCIKNSGDRTAVHILHGEDNYESNSSFLTPFHNYDENVEFKIGKYQNKKPNIYCIKKKITGSKTTEIHVLNGNNEYQSFLYQYYTNLQETDDNWNFEVGDYNENGHFDIFCIRKKNTESKKIEINILFGNDNYKSFSSNIITTLPETDNNWEFLLRDYNHDGKLDLYCINKNCENNSTEVKILSGDSCFQEFILDIKLDLYSIDNFEFCAGVYNGYECVFGIKKNEILEIHAFII